MDFFVQTKVLLYKEFIKDIRSWKTTFLRLILPSLSLILIAVLVNANLISIFTSSIVSGQYGDLPKCTTIRPDKECVTLLYTVPNGASVEFQNAVDTIMKSLTESNPTPLTFGVDVVQNNTIRASDYDFSSFSFLETYPNYTYGVVQWESYQENDTLLYLNYNIYWNASQVQLYTFLGGSYNVYVANYLETFEAAIERGILSYLTPGKQSSINVNIQSYPSPYTIALPGTVSWGLASTVIYVFVTIPSMIAAVGLVDEKATGIKGQMRIAGLMDSAYWTSVIIEQLVISFFSIILLLSIGSLIPDFVIFKQTNFFASLVIYMSYQFNCIACACLYSSFFSQKKTANIAMSIFIGVGILISLVFSTLDVFVYFIYYLDIVSIFAFVLQLIPTFSFSQMLLDVKVITVGPTYPFGCFSGNATDYYTFNNIYDMKFYGNPDYYDNEYGLGDCVNIPPALQNIIILLCTSIFFILLAAYFDKVLPSTNSISESIFFFLSPSFWFRRKVSKLTQQYSNYQNQNHHHNDDHHDDDHDHQYSNLPPALEIQSLSKTYKKGHFYSSDTEANTALRPLSLRAPPSTILCLLGPNGAGKTTTIGCLSGSISPTEGDAYIFGYSINRDMNVIKQMMGLCPQFDVLWDDLTADEHLYIFNGLKSSNERMSNEELRKRLEMVKLHNLSKVRSKSYSGGMKRRLSVVLSTLGNPKIIFLDEPTTGMDPDNRRYVWDLIQMIKKDKLIVLTTHSMEEADKLSDYVAMIAKGKLRCEGIPIQLKARFGAGYRLSLSIEESHVDDMKEFMKKALPDAYLRNENAGSLIYSLPDTDPDHTMADFFDFLNSKQLTYIKEWGLQNTTLEDVFITVTSKIMGEDIVFNNNSKKSNFDSAQRESQQQTLHRYEKRYRKLRNEAQLLRDLLDQYSINHTQIINHGIELEYNDHF